MQTKQDLLNLLDSTFRPHAPIEDPTAFQGRAIEQKRIRDALSSPGLHVAIFGERGAGKTSLANITTHNHQPLKIFCEAESSFTDICRAILLNIKDGASQRIEYNAEKNSIGHSGMSLRVDNIGSAELLQFLPATSPLCIILDELDRLNRSETVQRLGELCKQISTLRTNITLILIGIAKTAEELLAGHASNIRNLKQVHLDSMSDEELRNIIHHGEARLSISFRPEVISQLVTISDRAPFFVHILARRAAQIAIERESTIVTIEDFNAGTAEAADDCDVELSAPYQKALTSDGSQTRRHKRVIEALAQTDSRLVRQRDICSQINTAARQAGAEELKPQQVGRILKRLMSPEGGSIVTMHSSRLYRFTAPLMKGYVKLCMKR